MQELIIIIDKSPTIKIHIILTKCQEITMNRNIAKIASAFVLAASIISPAYAEEIELSGDPDTFLIDNPAFKKAMSCPSSTVEAFAKVLELQLKASIGDVLAALADVRDEISPDQSPHPKPPDTTIFQLASQGILPSAHSQFLSHNRSYEKINGVPPSAQESHAFFCKAVEEKSKAVIGIFPEPDPMP